MRKPASRRPVIRPATAHDHDALLDLVHEAFTGPDHDGDEEVQIVRATWRLQAVVPGLELVAVDDGEVIGHVLGARGAPGSPRAVGVAPLCVRPDRQNRGIGTALMQELLARAEGQRWPAFVVLGDPGYYSRFGFEAAGPLGFIYDKVGSNSPHFQIRRLSAFDPSVRGRFVYCWEVESDGA